MTLPELCIRRPVMTTLLMVSFIVFGFFGYQKLPVAALPRVDFPTIQVYASLPGANPETMAASVAAPLERAFATIPGVSLMTSTSNRGSTNVTLQFDLDRDIDGAALDVQSQISATLRRLPAELPGPPSFRKVNPADSPVLLLTLVSSTLPLATVNDYAEQVFSQQISQIAGVAQVAIFGQQKFAVRIAADPDKAAARGLTLNDIRTAVANANSNAPVGALQGQTQQTTLEASGQMQQASDYRPLVVAWRNGAPVRLDEIASVRDGVENESVAGWFRDDRAIVLAIFRQSDANTVEVVDAIKSRMASYQAQLPPSIEARVLVDRSLSIRDSVRDVQKTLLEAMVLVILVIFLFLKSMSATVIPALALPVSIIGTFAFMYLFGYSIDNISLLALTLAVGFVVDDAIVMLENIVRHIERGEKPFEAALRGSREIGFTILSITVSLIAVFIPVLFMGGVVGRVFREFAVVISVSILVSGVVSLTLTPMLCARVLHPYDPHEKHNFILRAADWGIEKLTRGYDWTLAQALKARVLMLLVTFATVAVSVQMYMNVPKGFFPQEDVGLLVGSTEAAPDVSFDVMAQHQRAIARTVMEDPAVEYLTSAIGFGGQSNRGQMFIQLKPKEQRSPIQEIMQRLRRETQKVAGVNAVFIPVQNFNLQGGRPSRAQYQYTMQSGDLDALYAAAPDMEQKMRGLPGLRDVTSDLQIKNPQLTIDIDREKAAALGLTSDQIRQTLFNAYGSRQISTIFTQSADYAVILDSTKSFQNDPTAVGRLYVRATNGAAIVPLAEVATIKSSVGPLSINRQSQQPAVTLSFNLAPGVSLGEAVESIRRAEQELRLPGSIVTNFTGTAALFQEALKGQGALLAAAVLTIYILLGVLYESYIHPITILSGLPSAGLGALLALNLYGMELTVIAIIGILMLIGIVKKNAIMMVDFAIERRKQGADALTAIHEAAVIRFRPIMMTTLAAIFGTLPIALGEGAGAELRQPLGVAVVGGLIVSQVLTLYITPVIYYYLDKVDAWISGRGAPVADVVEAPAGAEPAAARAAAE
ncbi:MAG: efflux RND transporter permease subunit [Rhizobiales bacterium]|nr:efflux RND transporter permease subunit [Hyphomicrobiales bacterium]